MFVVTARADACDSPSITDSIVVECAVDKKVNSLRHFEGAITINKAVGGYSVSDPSGYVA